MINLKKFKNHITKIEKREGEIVPFDRSKIEEAIFKALTATDEGGRNLARELSRKVTKLLNKRFKKDEIPNVEQIQDIVEEVLVLEGLVEAAKAYILYREQRRLSRESKVNLGEAISLVDDYFLENNWEVKENSNMAFSLQGLNHYVSAYISKKYWLNRIYPQEVRKANEEGDLHIHNLDILGAYCCGWDLYDVLLKGFGGVVGKIQSKPPKHFRTALGQVVNYFYTLQGESAGAQAFSNFDTLLAPFIKYDNLSYREIKQSLQEFLFNCNVPTRVGFQTPFENITLDLKVPEHLKEMPVILGGQPQKETYKEFQKEMDIFNQALTEVYIEGDASGRVFTFPIPTYNITKDFEWENETYNGIWQMTAKYGIPYFSNFINSDMKPEDARSMCLLNTEEVIIRENGVITRKQVGELIKQNKLGDFDEDGWVECQANKKLEVLSLNYLSGKTEWARVTRFLKLEGKQLITISTTDGKEIKCSPKHLVPVLTNNGLVNKFAEDITTNDYLLNLKKASDLNKEYQKIKDDLYLDEDLAKLLGYFTADGNYLFESRKNIQTFGQPRGLQFTFNSKTRANLEEIRELIHKVFGLETKEKQDPRYNSYYLYVYNSRISRILYQVGFKKYGRLPDILFNSPQQVIENFLLYHFKGDGYEKRQEIHLNDKELSRDLVILYSLIGKPVSYKERLHSQRIYLQHQKSELRQDGYLATPLLFQRVPGFLAKSTYLVPGLTKTRMVGINTLYKYEAATTLVSNIKESDYYINKVKSVKVENFFEPQLFFDLELDKNHLFVHSLGSITHNCCRLRLDNRELYKRGGGLFGANPLTGSIGVVTINLPRIGYLSKTKKEFFERLSRLMDLAKTSLEIKRKVLEDWTEKGLYPYSRYYLSNVKKMRDNYWGNHFSTIGIIGMNEALLNFLDVDIGSKRGQDFSLEVLDFMREKLVKYQEETGNLYNLEATPAEGTSYRLALLDKKKYPEIITAGEKEPFYTNSSQLPVNYTDDLFEALKLQDKLQTKYTGGTVFHAFLGETVSDPKVVKSLIKTVFERFKLPYFTLTPTFSVCPVHGYINGEHFTCPKCLVEQPCEVYSRIVGYLRPVSQWHFGKQEEFRLRKTFKV
ncbi:MAG TPA: anaerobic ribonucleoside-triphosphate reductase [Candidatus Paceibacterota bacterium]|mgnify:CR=1 FL=1|nr:anaerobic ribonucleoside-triphosphate reductase [Candidatus Paceibacterota bacterium]HPP64707.1 anaerobic ribonucleoside-triphosphate reductase [Candidatus Paceibacterota bacterium]